MDSEHNAPLCECGRWAEIREDGVTRRKGPPWRRRTETRWTWSVKRPDPLMPFGWSSCGGGSAWSYENALTAAAEKHGEWHEWDRRETEKRRIDFGEGQPS